MRRMEKRQEEIARLLERIDSALVVRDPGTARSVEAYDGLRRTVVAASKERRAHLAQLVQFIDALERGASVHTLAEKVEEWVLQAGLERWTQPEPVEWFDVVDGSGDFLEVVSPAWVDVADDKSAVLVRKGKARRVAASPRTDELVEANPAEPEKGATDAGVPVVERTGLNPADRPRTTEER